MPYLEGTGVEECDAADEEERGVESEEVGVSVDDVLRVVSRGDDHVSSHLNRFQPNRRSRDEFREVQYNSSDPKLKTPISQSSPPFHVNYFN